MAITRNNLFTGFITSLINNRMQFHFILETLIYEVAHKKLIVRFFVDLIKFCTKSIKFMSNNKLENRADKKY